MGRISKRWARATAAALALGIGLAVVGAAGADGSAPGGDDGQRFLQVTYDTTQGPWFAYTWVFPTIAEADAAAVQVGLCGFWRVVIVDGAPDRVLVPPGGVLQVRPMPLPTPVPPAQAALDAAQDEAAGFVAGSGPPPLPPHPDVELIVSCAAAGRSRLVKPMGPRGSSEGPTLP